MSNPHTLSLLAVSGRILLASLFVWSGLGKMFAAPMFAGDLFSGGLLASPTPVVAIGAFEFLAGLALAVGMQTRATAFALAAFTLLASVMFHDYWTMAPDQAPVQQLLFAKNLALAGALLFVGVLGAGRWRLVVHSNTLMSGANGTGR
jgi:putative oxidoreductase